MPPLKFVEVVTYSSEDSNHPVNNLLKPDTYLKWKSEAGRNEKQEYVVLKLEQLTSIHSIDIGNENCAFIEVLVSRDGKDFKVLLVASAFMSPLESRNNSTPNRVRMFGMDKLNKNVAEERWDRIKVVCTQPFNKNLQYGLTFLKVYGPENKPNSEKEINLGKFTIRENDDEEEPLPMGSFFAKRRESGDSEGNSSYTQGVKRANEEVSPSSPSNAPNSAFYQLKKKIKESSLAKSNDSPIPKPFKPENKKSDEKPTVDKPISKKVDAKPATSKLEQNSIPKVARDSSLKVKMKRKSRAFKKLMSDVVFVLSGYQNPKRSQLRDSLIDMGAKYKGDWGKGCTHLICAFKNTPKFQSVKGRGKIVSEKWIEDSHTKKIRLPWRRYNLEENEDDVSEEEEIWATEICPSPENGDTSEDRKEALSDTDDLVESEDTDDEIQRALGNDASKDTSRKKTDVDVTKKNGGGAPRKNTDLDATRKRGNVDAPRKNDEDSSRKKTDLDATRKRGNVDAPRKNDEDSSRKKTDVDASRKNGEEAPRKNANPEASRRTADVKENSSVGNGISSDDEYGADTDVDEDEDNNKKKDTRDVSLPPLKNIFRGKNMYMFGSSLDGKKKKALERYIVAFQGTVLNYMSEDVNFIITDDAWDENFDNALEENPSLQFVKSQWIWKCCNSEKMVPPQPFLVVPKE